ncbi:MAG TPA: GerMN domain-containing protein [Symbiobacteriaceae bacterium]
MKRAGHKSSGGGLRAFAGPVGLVVLGIAVVFGMGYWVSNRKTPETPAAAPKADGSSAQTPSKPAPSQPAPSQPAPSQPAPSQPESQTPAPAVDANKAAILAKRAQIDRSGGAAKTMLVTVYYDDGLYNGDVLQPVEIKVPQDPALIKVTAQQVIQAPGDELKLYSSFPKGTTVQSVALANGVLRVDLSPEAATVQGSAAVNDIQATLVYSLTQIKGVNAVQLLVNGRPAMLHGMDLSKPITRADLEGRNLFKVQPVIRYAGKP